MTDFKEKLFDSHFATQCCLISNCGKLPPHIKYLTDNRLSFVNFSHDKIAKVILNLDPNKVHSHDNISIRMVKVCGPSIYKPLEIIFNQCLEIGVFLSEWKKGNIVPVHKKGDKQMLQNYRPVLLPIYGEIFERLLFNEMVEFFIENKLISSSQSGFKPGDSFIINCYLLLMRYIVLLMKALKLEVYSSIPQRHLIRCGMMVSLLN